MLGAVERPGLAEAPGDLGLPRHGAQRVEVGLDREVDVAHLAADDRRVAEVGPHHGRAEGDALLAHALEVPDRDVLAARDAVQVGVEQPDGADAEAAHRPDGGLGLVVLTQLRASFAQERTCTGRRLMPLKKFERRRVGGPASSMRSRYGIISSSQIFTSSFARCAPRQKCGPPSPKVRCRLGARPTSRRYGSANFSSS